MPTTALVLVLGSAVVHAYWNLLYKQAKDKQAFPVFKSLGSWVIMALLGAIWWTIEPPTSLEFIPLAVLSGACYAGYFVFMSAAYERGEALKKRCEELLKQAETRIEKIRLGADGKPAGATPLDVE